jgi:hypothetical protein
VSEQEPHSDPERFLGAPPRPLSRRALIAWLGGTAASLASGAGAQTAGEVAYLREEVRRTGPDAKIVAVHGLDLQDLDPHRNVRGYNWNPDIGARFWMVSKE